MPFKPPLSDQLQFTDLTDAIIEHALFLLYHIWCHNDMLMRLLLRWSRCTVDTATQPTCTILLMVFLYCYSSIKCLIFSFVFLYLNE